MIAESMAIRALYDILLTIGPRERWSAARHSFSSGSAGGGGLIVFAVIALIISILLVLWVFAKHKRSENRLRRKITELTIANDRLQQEIAELDRKQIEVLESIIDAEPSSQEIPSLNAQEIKALSELGKRLL